MSVRKWLVSLAGVAGLGLMITSAQAAPAGAIGPGLQEAAGETSAVEQAHYGRRCWRHRGHLHCRGYSRYYGGPYFGYRYGHRHHRHHRRWH